MGNARSHLSSGPVGFEVDVGIGAFIQQDAPSAVKRGTIANAGSMSLTGVKVTDGAVVGRGIV